jgi:hypothetical protein
VLAVRVLGLVYGKPYTLLFLLAIIEPVLNPILRLRIPHLLAILPPDKPPAAFAVSILYRLFLVADWAFSENGHG